MPTTPPYPCYMVGTIKCFDLYCCHFSCGYSHSSESVDEVQHSTSHVKTPFKRSDLLHKIWSTFKLIYGKTHVLCQFTTSQNPCRFTLNQYFVLMEMILWQEKKCMPSSICLKAKLSISNIFVLNQHQCTKQRKRGPPPPPAAMLLLSQQVAGTVRMEACPLHSCMAAPSLLALIMVLCLLADKSARCST